MTMRMSVDLGYPAYKHTHSALGEKFSCKMRALKVYVGSWKLWSSLPAVFGLVSLRCVGPGKEGA
jgi:hypothetical protein